MFLKHAFFLGEHKLDRVLESILVLSEYCRTEETQKGSLKLTHLINVKNFQTMIQKQFPHILKKFKSARKDKRFSYLHFAEQNNIKYGDLLSGKYPTVFNDYRRVLHSLKLSRAIILTCRMKQIPVFGMTRYRKATLKPSTVNPLTRIFVSIYNQLRIMKIEDECQIIKCFKASLCFEVSRVLDQEESPEGTIIRLIPSEMKYKISQLHLSDQVNFYFSLLQSKALCQDVPKSFVKECLEKHREQLGSPHEPMDPTTLSILEQEGIEFGKVVRRFYHPERGFFPTGKATFEFPRNMGGIKGEMVYKGRISNSFDDSQDRPEPFVIGLFGQPGQGKSVKIHMLKRLLRSFFPGKDFNQIFYSRSCSCEHWDGYNGQPVTILDDLGQSRSGKDIQEFQTLISCNPYVLPMADLSEKGMKFSSSIVVVTSNLGYGVQLDSLYREQCGIIDDFAFWRRFHLPLIVDDMKIYRFRKSLTWTRKSVNRPMVDGGDVLQRLHTDPLTNFMNWKSQDIEETSDLDIRKLITNIYEQRRYFHNNVRSFWDQTIFEKSTDYSSMIGKEFYREQLQPMVEDSSDDESDTETNKESRLPKTVFTQKASLRFDAYPPDRPLNVRVEPIIEPLKVRTITAAEGDLFCLKPLQRAMWQALGEFPQYCLTHGTQNLEPAIKRIFDQSSEQDVWISGDYTAATDSVAIEASQAIMRGILSQIDHEPTKRWAMKELEPHLLFYPKSSGLAPVLQRNGQLMGSFLSFPLLCILNNSTAKYSGLKPDQYLINGDDILMRTPPSTYPIWKSKVQEFGLTLSMGKNYIHKDFGTVNSQLIFKDTVLFSGKQRLLDRRSRVLGECLRDLEIQLGDDRSPDEIHQLFCSINRSKLRETIRSKRVPSSHGGLSLSWGSPPEDKKSLRNEIFVYLHDLFKKLEPIKGCVAFPYLSEQKFEEEDLRQMETCFNEPVSNKEYKEDFLDRKSLDFMIKKTELFPSIQHLFLEKSIREFPPLTFVQVKQIPFYEDDREEVQKIIHMEFLTAFLQHKSLLDYQRFRDRILQKRQGLQLKPINHEYVVNLFDLELPCDFLDEINAFEGPDPRPFDSKLFQTKLGVQLTPKQFDVPKIQPVDLELYAGLLESPFRWNPYRTDICSYDVTLKEIVLHELRESFKPDQLRNEVVRKKV